MRIMDLLVITNMPTLSLYQRVMFAFSLKALFVLIVSAIALTLTSNAFAAAGDLFVSDLATNSILVYSPDGTKSTFASGLNRPQGLGFDQYGNLYAADLGSGRILKFTADGTGSTFTSGLLGPAGLSLGDLDGDGKLFVSENSGNRIDKFKLDGTKSLFASVNSPYGIVYDNPSLYIATHTSEVKATDPADPPTTISSGNNSRSVNRDFHDNLFVSSDSGVIFKVASDGTKTIFASGLSGPSGMAFDHLRKLGTGGGEPDHGNLFVADRLGGGHIFKFTPLGVRTTFASGGSPNFLAFQPGMAGKAVNISTRGRVLTGDNVLIGGFIITGTVSKQVVIRAIGPSLSNVNPPVPGALADPVLELHKPDGSVVLNDNWKSTQEAQIQATGLAPKKDLESAIVITLPPGPYTAIVRGKNGGIGVALVEVYDLNSAGTSELANISTRGFVDTDDNVMIGGFIITSPLQDGARVLVRAIGPTLANANPPVSGSLADPTLELHDGNGAIVAFNDNWTDAHPAAIQRTGLAPKDGRESAILANLRPGAYTGIVRGKNKTTGVALIEVYHVP
jgi:hypothetical protein